MMSGLRSAAENHLRHISNTYFLWDIRLVDTQKVYEEQVKYYQSYARLQWLKNVGFLQKVILP
jgi:hypothetical protein